MELCAGDRTELTELADSLEERSTRISNPAVVLMLEALAGDVRQLVASSRPAVSA